MTVAQNIKAIRDIFHITQRELARVAGVTENAVSKWENGYAEPRMGAVERIAACYGLTKYHIIEDGGMDYFDPVTKTAQTPHSVPTVSLGEPSMALVRIPLVEHLPVDAASNQKEPGNNPVDPKRNLVVPKSQSTISVPRTLLAEDPDCYACVIANEDESMNMVFPHECAIVISPNKEPGNGSIAVVEVEGLGTVIRRFYHTEQTTVLSAESYSGSYDDIVIGATDKREVRLRGTVAWFQPLGPLR